MSTALLVMTDGRDDLLAQTIASAKTNLIGDITERYIHDDTGSQPHRELLAARYPEFRVIGSHRRKGFGGAIDYAWGYLRLLSSARHIFHLEDDVTFNCKVKVDEMAALLVEHPELAQVALRRQPWNDRERKAGGVVEADPDAFADRDGYLEHTLFFTTNPSLYRRELILENSWPSGAESEGHFSALLRNRGLSFAYWGSRDSGEWVTHIGDERAGKGY